MMGWQQRWWPYMISNYDRSLSKLLGMSQLPPEAMLPNSHVGAERIFAMSARTSIEAGERYQVLISNLR